MVNVCYHRPMRLLTLALIAILPGCAGSQPHFRALEMYGDIGVTPSGSDYIVSIKNKRDVDYNMEDRKNRHQLAVQYMSAQCPRGASVIDETSITTGTYLLGNPAKTYAVRVRCAS